MNKWRHKIKFWRDKEYIKSDKNIKLMSKIISNNLKIILDIETRKHNNDNITALDDYDFETISEELERLIADFKEIAESKELPSYLDDIFNYPSYTNWFDNGLEDLYNLCDMLIMTRENKQEKFIWLQ